MRQTCLFGRGALTSECGNQPTKRHNHSTAPDPADKRLVIEAQSIADFVVTIPKNGIIITAQGWPTLRGDDYAVLGDGDNKIGYTLRLYYKPLVSWIWGGAVIMALGGLIAAFGRQRAATKQASLPQNAASALSTPDGGA